MTAAQKFTIAGRLRRAIIDLAQAGNYVERGDAPRTVANIGAAVDHLTEALATIRACGPDSDNRIKGGPAARSPPGEKKSRTYRWEDIKIDPRCVVTAIGDMEHNVHVGPPAATDPLWGTLKSPWLSCGCGKKDIRGRRTARLSGKRHHPNHPAHAAWHRELGRAYARGLELAPKTKKKSKKEKKEKRAESWWRTK